MTMKLTVLRSIFYVMHEDDERSLATMTFRLLHSVYTAEELTARCADKKFSIKQRRVRK